jgi:hypothetical protein
MGKCANISPFMRRPLVIYDFATAPFRISLYIYEEYISQCPGLGTAELIVLGLFITGYPMKGIPYKYPRVTRALLQGL